MKGYYGSALLGICFLGTFVAGVRTPARADLLVGSNRTDSVLRYDEQTGAFLGEFINSGSGGLKRPGGVVLGPDGNIFVSSNMTDSILRYSPSGAFLGEFVPSGFNGLSKPSGLRFGPDGNLYVNSHGDKTQPNVSTVLRFDGRTGAALPAPGKSGATFVTAGSGGLDQDSVGIVFGKDGNLYINSHLTNSVLRFDGQTGDPNPAPGRSGADFVASGSGGLNQPSGLVFGPDGNLYVAAHTPSAGHGAVFRFNGQSGDFLDMFVSVDSGGLANPTSLVFGPDGHLYIDSRRNASVLRFDETTGLPLPASGQSDATFVAQGTGGLNAPNSLLFLSIPVPQPVSVAGYSADVISDKDLSARFAQPFDGRTFAWFEAGAVDDNGAAHNDGLPAALTFVSATGSGATYQVQPANAKNVLQLSAGQTGTFTLTTPATYGTLFVIASSGDGTPSSVGSGTIHFANGSAQSFSYNSFDWCNGQGGLHPEAILPGPNGRADVGADGKAFVYNRDCDFQLYESVIPIDPSSAGVAITSIDFMGAPDAFSSNVFGVSGK
jgi:glucose/arabinose dehydrogenase